MAVTGLFVFLTGFAIVFGAPNDAVSSGGKKKYEAVTADPLNWYAAYQYCRREGRQLATITSNQENDGLTTELNRIRKSLGNPDHCYWLGLTSIANNGYWYWMTTGKNLMDFNAWDVDQPKTNYNQDMRCAFAGHKSDNSWFWYTKKCWEICYFVCEYQE